MTLGAIVAESVAELAADDCQLHLWTTNGFLPDARWRRGASPTSRHSCGASRRWGSWNQRKDRETMTEKRLSPLQAIRARCVDCSETLADVRCCDRLNCSLYPYRMSHLPKQQPRHPLKAIRAYCLWRCDGSSKDVSLCHPLDCPMREFRFGKNPARARKGPSVETAVSRG